VFLRQEIYFNSALGVCTNSETQSQSGIISPSLSPVAKPIQSTLRPLQTRKSADQTGQSKSSPRHHKQSGAGDPLRHRRTSKFPFRIRNPQVTRIPPNVTIAAPINTQKIISSFASFALTFVLANSCCSAGTPPPNGISLPIRKTPRTESSQYSSSDPPTRRSRPADTELHNAPQFSL